MSSVMFATICDTCKRKSPEYDCWPVCSECLEDICPECCVWTYDEEATKNFCHKCKREWEGVTVKGTLYMGMTLEEIIADQQRQHPERLAELCARLPQEPLMLEDEGSPVLGWLVALPAALAFWAAGWACFRIWRAW